MLIRLFVLQAGFFSSQVVSVYKSYVLDGYPRVRNPTSNPSPIGMSFHDAFQNLNSWTGFLPKSSYSGVSLDTHIYTVFSNPEIAYSDTARIQSFCARASAFEASGKNYNTYIGGESLQNPLEEIVKSDFNGVTEWAPATTDCAPNLNGKSARTLSDSLI